MCELVRDWDVEINCENPNDPLVEISFKISVDESMSRTYNIYEARALGEALVFMSILAVSTQYEVSRDRIVDVLDKTNPMIDTENFNAEK